jgi:DNA primase
LANDWAVLIKQVKEANDIVDVVGGYLSLQKAGESFKGLCPFHDDHRPSFSVSPRKQNYRCWSCDKSGDVFAFVQEHERVSFREALELLARRAGISLRQKDASPENQGRVLLLDTVRWAAEQFQRCLLEDPLVGDARKYLGERGLTGETVRRFGLGFAPLSGDWLVKQAEAARISFDLLEKVGLIARRDSDKGFYDRFRERIVFPIRDSQGRIVGFGGRILPSSPYANRLPKYYNSTETTLFKKSELLYGLDQARQAAAKAGYLAVVEGYTDVLMAHQLGVAQVVATMGTALNSRHVHQLRRFAPRVVLVFDADAGGTTGVDRALEIFVSQDVDLSIATLPEGLDPCDLLVQQGPEPFRACLASAVDALEFKLNRALAAEASNGVEGRRRVLDAVLGIMALASEMPGEAGAVKQQLIVSRLAQRLGIKEETIWARLKELRAGKRRKETRNRDSANGPEDEGLRSGKAPAHERNLMEVLLAEPALVPIAAAQLPLEWIQHPTVRWLVESLYRLHAEGEPPELDQLRLQIDDPRMAERLLQLQYVGRHEKDRPAWLKSILAIFRERQAKTQTQELKNQLHSADDHAQAVALLRRLQDGSGDP